ncbi:MAG: RND transporter [Nevskiaceae bacterium]|nr:MAG: RND transporter [Nevskiaceae bacterium]TBR72100.1 MAG: RND transporter [Nevskiaceae bacterium]
MKNIRSHIARVVVANRLLVGIVFIAITAGFIAGLPSVNIRTIFNDLLPADDPYVQTYFAHPQFGNPLTVTVMVKRTDGQNIFNHDTLEKIKKITVGLDLIPGINHDLITSITSPKATYAAATPNGVEMAPVMGNEVPSSPAQLAQLSTHVDHSPIVRAFMVSPDKKATLIRATFMDNLDYGVVFKDVRKLVHEAQDQNTVVEMVGEPILTGWVYELQKQTYIIFGVTLLLLSLALIFYMRNVTGVTVPVVCAGVAAIWGFGLVGWLGIAIEPLLMVVPLLLVARTFSHCIQYTERYYELLEVLGNKRTAAEATLTVMMAPSVTGILTDVIAIFAIGVAPIPAMQRFALFCGCWAIFIIPTGVVLSTVLLSYLPRPRNIAAIAGKAGGERGIHKLQKLALEKIAYLVTGRPARYTSAFMVAISVAAVMLALEIPVGNPTEGSNLLWNNSDYNTSVRDINDHFPGINSLEIILESKNSNSQTVRAAMTAEAYAISQKIQRMAEEDKTTPVMATRSFTDYMEAGNSLFSGGSPKWFGVAPADKDVKGVGNTISFGQNPLNYADVTDLTFQNSTISLYYRDNKQATVDGALALAKKAVKAVGADHKYLRVRLASGTIALQQATNHVVERYHMILFSLCCVAIFFLTWFAYRALMAPVILLVPVILSNYYLVGTMNLLGIGLDINAVMVTVLGVGVGIDYGIYLLSRIIEEYAAQGRDWGRAISEALVTTGKAIMFTALIMLIGILPWYFLSDLKFMAQMGLLLAAIMLINMLLALVVLPLMVWLLKPKFISREDNVMGEALDLSIYQTYQGTAESTP